MRITRCFSRLERRRSPVPSFHIVNSSANVDRAEITSVLGRRNKAPALGRFVSLYHFFKGVPSRVVGLLRGKRLITVPSSILSRIGHRGLVTRAIDLAGDSPVSFTTCHSNRGRSPSPSNNT